MSLAQALIHAMPATMGACLIGSYLSSVLYGVTLLQTYQYYSKYYGKDKMYLTILVAVLTVLDTFGLILNMHSMWFFLIKNFANPLLNIDWSQTLSVMITALVAFLVQMFYAYRAYILGKRKVAIPGLIILLSLCSLGFAITYMAQLYTADGSLLRIPSLTYISTTSLACGFTADLLIASSISTYLMQGRQSGMRPTQNLIRKLIIYTIGTGVVTSTCHALTLILGEAFPHTLYNCIFYFPLSKCYVNSMLAFLNHRDALREEREDHISYHISASSGRSLQLGQIGSHPTQSAKDKVHDVTLLSNNSAGKQSERKVVGTDV